MAILPKLSIITLMSIPTIVTPGILLSAITRCWGATPRERPISWGLILSYLLFFFLDRKTPSTIPRTSSIVRSLPIWSSARQYFNAMTIPRQSRLNPCRTYLLCLAPHGIFAYSVWANYVSKKQFPELHHTRLANISANFVVPVMRDVMQAAGLVPADKRTLVNLLTSHQNTAMLLGGSKEAAHHSEKSIRLVLASRYGFLRVALEANSPVLIIMHMGENQTFKGPFERTTRDNVINEKKDNILVRSIRGFQSWFLRTMTFALPLVSGVCGLMPYPSKLRTVIAETPLDLRIFVEFYYFLLLNKKYLGFSPQCPVCFDEEPLDISNINHIDSNAVNYHNNLYNAQMFSQEAFPHEYILELERGNDDGHLQGLSESEKCKKYAILNKVTPDPPVPAHTLHIPILAKITGESQNVKDITQDINILWANIDTNIISWLLLIYVGELVTVYDKYSIFNTDTNQVNETKLELADFDVNRYVAQYAEHFIYFAQSTTLHIQQSKNSNSSLYNTPYCNCLFNQQQKPSYPPEKAYKYRYGIEANKYLLLHQYNRRYLFSQLGIYLRLKEQYNIVHEPISDTTKANRKAKL